ncbi:preprotein translocase subunit SecE [Prevotella dentasini]|uniref:preprotein translocase subunit SecE n=1 Tax=Prevotella dentasini TaxID=589537 RepID=UPI000A051846|nr:preprotein translocase subunit SecE [Prevotella dentasini]
MFKRIITYIVNYCKDCYDELAHKTTWPSRGELTHSAMVVLSASLIIALVVFAFDFVSQHVMEFVYPQ